MTACTAGWGHLAGLAALGPALSSTKRLISPHTAEDVYVPPEHTYRLADARSTLTATEQTGPSR